MKRLVPLWLLPLALLGPAMAEPMLTASHQPLQIDTGADGQRWLTLSLTLENTGSDDLHQLTLTPMPGLPFGPHGLHTELSVGTLAAYQSTSLSWQLPLTGGLSTDSPVLEQLTFAAHGQTLAGEGLGLPVDSLREEP